MEKCELIAVVLVALLPTALIAGLIYHFGQPIDNGILCVGLMIFIALLVLWCVVRCWDRNKDVEDQNILIDTPEIIVEEIATKTPSATNATPIFTPILSNLTLSTTLSASTAGIHGTQNGQSLGHCKKPEET